jgi:hypothetical protein
MPATRNYALHANAFTEQRQMVETCRFTLIDILPLALLIQTLADLRRLSVPIVRSHDDFVSSQKYASAHPRGGGGGGCRAAARQTPKTEILKKTDFVDIMISKVLRDFPFSRNQPLKSADD